MKFGDLEVSVLVDGANLPEYEEQSVTPPDGVTTISCWIPSEIGQAFTVRINFLESKPYDRSARLLVDGMFVGGNLRRKKAPSSSGTIEGWSTSLTTIRRFVFSALETTDDEQDLSTGLGGVQDIGEIKVELWEVIIGESKKQFAAKEPTCSKQVHEKAKKAMNQCIGLGGEAKISEGYYYNTKKIRLLATFAFRYRSKGILLAQGILPPEPDALEGNLRKRKAEDSDVNSSDEVGDVESSDEEKQQAELKVLLQRINKIQSSLGKKHARVKKNKIKKEPKSSFISGEVIDLT